MSGLSQVSQVRRMSGLTDSMVDHRLSFFAIMLCTLALKTDSLFFFVDFEGLVLRVEH